MSDGPTIKVDLEGFKKLTAQFTKSLQTATEDEADVGWHCLGLAYLGLDHSKEVELLIAASYLEYAARRYMEKSDGR
jgi:hypothetical protein